MNKLSTALKPIPFLPVALARYVLFATSFVAAILVRLALYGVVTGDYTAFLSQWYDFIHAHGGFAAMKYNFSNYNPPYLYLIAIATYLPIPKLFAIKSISVIFDLVLALFAYLILRLKYQQSLIPLIGATVLLFTPTIVINSAAWAQCDAIYAAFCLGSLYFLLKQRGVWACVFFGLAIAFKLQAIFFLPVLLMVVLKKELPLRNLLLIPIVFLLLLAPAYVAGRDAGSLLTVYSGQMSTGGMGAGEAAAPGGQRGPAGGTGRPQFDPGSRQSPASQGGQTNQPRNGFEGGAIAGFGGGVQFTSLSYNAPTIYQWFKNTALAYNKWVGIVLAALLVSLVGGLVLASKGRLTPSMVMNIGLVCVVAIPFFLPEMHERYFYLADVISIIYVFWFPRAFYLAVIMQIASLISYTPYLLNADWINLAYVSFAVLWIALIAAARLAQSTRAMRYQNAGFNAGSAGPAAG